MARFIIGKAYHNVSEKMLREVAEIFKESAEDEEVKIFYIVPDQFEYETEKAVYRILDGNNLISRAAGMEIRTFSSLSEEILKASDEQKLPADDIMKNIIMHSVVRENKDSLKAFAKIAEKPGFCQKMVQTITMLKTAGVSAEELTSDKIDKLVAQTDSSERARDIRNYKTVTDKLKDVGLLYSLYNTRLSQNYLDKLDYTTLAAKLVSCHKTDIFDDAYVFVDCFNDFTNSQMMFLYEIMKRAYNVTLGFVTEMSEEEFGGTVETDGDSSRKEVFAALNAKIARLKEEADNSAKEDEQISEMLSDGFSVKIAENSSVRHLSDNIFGSGTPSSSENPPELISAGDSYEELDFIAARIKKLIAENDYRYKDIAVLCTDPAQYKSSILSAFSKYDIPVFCDIPEPIIHQPLVNMIITLLNALKEFTTDNVLSYVKTGFVNKPYEPRGISDDGEQYEDECEIEYEADVNDGIVTGEEPSETAAEAAKTRTVGLSGKDIDVFENYIFEWTIGADTLKSEFKFNDRNTPHAEKIRCAVVEPLLELREKIKGANGDEITEQLFDFIIKKLGIQRSISARCFRDGKPDSALVDSYQRLWDTVVGIFDSLHDGLEGERISLSDYIELFRDICSTTSLANPPQFIDAVLVGDIDRTRAGDVKAVFIAGATYEALPTPTTSEGVFSQFETELIRENIVQIDEISRKYSLTGAKDGYCLSLYRAYRAVSLPSELLCVSYPENDLTGKPMQRSEIFDEILKLFKNAEVKKASSFPEDFYCRSLKATKLRFAAGLYTDSAEHSAVRKALCENGMEDFAEKLETLRKRRAENQIRRIKEKTSDIIFAHNISATKAETLSLCRFLYFCKHGLRIREITQRSFNGSKRGTAVHYAMENVLKDYCDRMDEFTKLDRETVNALVVKYLDEYRKNEMNENFSGDKRIEYLYNNIAVAATDVLTVMQAEFGHRKYRPQFFELDLVRDKSRENKSDNSQPERPSTDGYEITSPNNETIKVKPLTVETDKNRVIKITGDIDRVDMFTDDSGQRFLRVVDYKTFNTEFNARHAKYGVNTQMLWYLFALCEANEDIKPGGVSYTPAKISGAITTKMQLANILLMNHSQSGMYVKDEPSPKADNKKSKSAKTEASLSADAPENNDSTQKEMDEYLGYLTDILNAEVSKKYQMPSKFSDEFAEYKKECLDNLKDKIDLLFNGDITPLPLKYSKKIIKIEDTSYQRTLPCDYCKFKDICGHIDGYAEIPSEKAEKEAKEKAANSEIAANADKNNDKEEK